MSPSTARYLALASGLLALARRPCRPPAEQARVLRFQALAQARAAKPSAPKAAP